MVGIHGRQVATATQGYTAPHRYGGAFHITSQLHAVAVITGNQAATLHLIATTDHSIAAKVGVLQTKRKNVVISRDKLTIPLAIYFSMLVQIVSFG